MNPVTQKIEEQFGNIPKDISALLPEPLDPRQTELVFMGAVTDVAQFTLGLVPWIGDILADMVGDNIEANMRRRFTEPERKQFAEQTRFLPSGIATFRVFQRERAGKT